MACGTRSSDYAFSVSTFRTIFILTYQEAILLVVENICYLIRFFYLRLSLQDSLFSKQTMFSIE